MIANLITLALLILLQAVLGFDNLLYINLESKKAPLDKQKNVRNIGIIIAMVLRIALLFFLVKMHEYIDRSVFKIDITQLHMHISIHSIIVLVGGGFILYTAIKEIWHMLYLEHDEEEKEEKVSVNKIIGMIVIMNLVFSVDSILSAMALTDTFWVMAAAIVISGVMMIWLSDKVAAFLKKNRMYEVLGLFVLFIVGIMLLSEGAHMSHLEIFGYKIEAMSKATFYFVLGVLVIVDIIQGKYQKKLLKQKEENSQK